MKNTLLILTGMLVLGACRKDDETPFIPPTYENTPFSITEARAVDFGASEGHYNYDLHLIDGSLDDNNVPGENATVYIYTELFAPGTTAFTTGTFVYSEQPLADKTYFTTAVVALDSNLDGKITEADEIIPATGGELKVEGSDLDWTLTFSLNMLNGKSLKGMYKGKFELRVMQ